MATQTSLTSGSGYGNVYVDSLIWGGGWTGIDTPIRYWFGSGAVAAADSLIGGFTGATWYADEKSAFEEGAHGSEGALADEWCATTLA